MLLKIAGILLLLACAYEVNGKCEGKQEYRLQVKMEWLSKDEFRRRPNENIVGLLVVTHGEDFKLFEPDEELDPALVPFVTLGTVGPAVPWLLSGEFNVNLFGVMESGPAYSLTTTPFEVTKYASYLSIMGVIKGEQDFFFGTAAPVDLCSSAIENFTRVYPDPSIKPYEFFASYNVSSGNGKVSEADTTFKFGYFKMTQTQLINSSNTKFSSFITTPEPEPEPTVTPEPQIEPVMNITEQDTQHNVPNTREIAKPRNERSQRNSRSSTEAACFPSDATVRLESDVVKRMDELAVGDRVWVGGDSYSAIFMFTHKPSDNAVRVSRRHEFLELETAHGTITLTSGHYLSINRLIATAGSARVGDIVKLGSGEFATIINIRTTFKRTALYNPQTHHGSIVVNGVVASCYTDAVQQRAAHALLAPLRALYVYLGIVFRALENGGDFLMQRLPKGIAAR